MTERSGRGRAAGHNLRRRLFGTVRSRIIASYVLLLVIALVASVLTVRQVLLVRLDDRIADDLEQEVGEFRALAGGKDPEDGKPFGADVRSIFEVYFDRNVPGEGEELIAVTRRGPPRFLASEGVRTVTNEQFIFDSELPRWRQLSDVERGELETPAGPVRYIAVPIQRAERPLGTFVVANFPASEREEVTEAIQIVAAVAGVVLLLGTVIAFSISGRVLAPLRELRDATQSVSGSDMRHRIAVESEDELGQLGQTFNRMLDRLEHAFSSQREFIREVSHELRTPIAVVRGHLELLGEGLLEEQDRRRTIALVTGELDRMNRFVEDLLLLARAENPDFLRLETVRLDELLDEQLAKLKQTSERAWVLDATTRRLIVADPQRLTQAVMNLASNATQHTHPGDEIGIGAVVEGDFVRIWVRDSGEGIGPGERERIFERFSRGTSSRRYEGTGLGLAIVRAIAEAHGGQARVTSPPGEGAVFELRLPVDAEQPHLDGQRSEAEVSA